MGKARRLWDRVAPLEPVERDAEGNIVRYTYRIENLGKPDERRVPVRKTTYHRDTGDAINIERLEPPRRWWSRRNGNNDSGDDQKLAN